MQQNTWSSPPRHPCHAKLILARLQVVRPPGVARCFLKHLSSNHLCYRPVSLPTLANFDPCQLNAALSSRIRWKKRDLLRLRPTRHAGGPPCPPAMPRWQCRKWMTITPIRRQRMPITTMPAKRRAARVACQWRTMTAANPRLRMGERNCGKSGTPCGQTPSGLLSHQALVSPAAHARQLYRRVLPLVSRYWCPKSRGKHFLSFLVTGCALVFAPIQAKPASFA